MDTIAFLIALVGVLITLGHGGYLLALGSAAKRKRAGGEAAQRLTRSRWPAALIATVAALIGLAITGGGIGYDIVGVLIAGGSAYAAVRGLQKTHRKFIGGSSGQPELPGS